MELDQFEVTTGTQTFPQGKGVLESFTVRVKGKQGAITLLVPIVDGFPVELLTPLNVPTVIKLPKNYLDLDESAQVDQLYLALSEAN